MSQHSTTTTETHTLIKYSRSYGLGADPHEWQHFVNPVIKVLLEMKKSPKGDLTSVRLRILWLMNSGNDSMDVDKREITFEDIELLSFSSLPNNTQPIRSAQGLPLKAVHRDSVVGIRYLHPIMAQPNSSPIYRRFQITFESNSEASQFIDAIRHICPCKLHEPPVLGRTSTTASSSAQVQVQNARQPTLQKNAPALVSSVFTHYPPPTQRSAVQAPPRFPVVQSSPLGAASPSNIGLSSFQSQNFSTPLNMSSSPSSLSLSNPHKSTHNPAPPLSTSAGTNEKPSVDRETSKANPTLGQHSSSNPSLPSSSQPSLNSDSSAMLPPPVPSRALQSVVPISTSAALPGGSSHEFLGALRETSALYSLSRADLETLVSHVVREEGFAELLENLDSMWRVKGFLAR